MKTSIINNLAAIKRRLWRLTVSGLLTITAPLTVTADYINVTNGATVTATPGLVYSDTRALGYGFLAQNANSKIIFNTNTLIKQNGMAIDVYAYLGGGIELGDHTTVIQKTAISGLQAQGAGSLITAGSGLSVSVIRDFAVYALDNARIELGANATINAAGFGLRADSLGVITGSNATIYTGVKMNADCNPLDATDAIADSAADYVSSGRAGAYALYAQSGGLVELWNASANALSGSSAAIYTLNGGTVAMRGGTLTARASGLIVATGSGASAVILENVTTSNAGDAVTVSGKETLLLDLVATDLTGGMTVSDTATLTVNLNASAWTGSGTHGIDAVLTVNLDNDSTWNMTDNSTVTNLAPSNSGKVVFQKDPGTFKTLTTRNLSGSGEFHMNTDLAAGDADRLIVSGTSAGSHQVRITNHGAQTLGTEDALLLIETADGQASFNGSVSVGMFDYSLYQDQTDWYLSVSGTNLPPNPPTPPTPPSLSDGGKIILIVPPSIGQNWFDHTKTIGNHLGDLRDDKAGILEALWVRSYGAQLNIAPNMTGSGVREYQYGVDIGGDHRWNLDKGNTLTAGGFVGYGRIDRALRNGFGGSADTDHYHAGVYAIWQHECGLWADIIAKGQYADSQLSAWDASQNHMTASYGNWGGGVTLDAGKKFSFDQGWFVEPSLSAGYAHLMGNNYTTGGANQFAVSISDADLFQFRVGVAFGRALKLKNSGVLQPYLKIAGVQQISTGGKVTASGSEWRPNFDGARAEVGGGILWQLNADHQLSLDYEASFGDKYDKPWGLTAGYRCQF
ncbi:MAG: autotransporter outer membrane beta-barrel domain-containing protein [Verrucomicrobiales bacterium]|nr:autotransporter outer membrane beta-barrel domain-containing protein [Verrucomicrobiales bacterium]